MKLYLKCFGLVLMKYITPSIIGLGNISKIAILMIPVVCLPPYLAYQYSYSLDVMNMPNDMRNIFLLIVLLTVVIILMIYKVIKETHKIYKKISHNYYI